MLSLFYKPKTIRLNRCEHYSYMTLKAIAKQHGVVSSKIPDNRMELCQLLQTLPVDDVTVKLTHHEMLQTIQRHKADEVRVHQEVEQIKEDLKILRSKLHQKEMDVEEGAKRHAQLKDTLDVANHALAECRQGKTQSEHIIQELEGKVEELQKHEIRRLKFTVTMPTPVAAAAAATVLKANINLTQGDAGATTKYLQKSILTPPSLTFDFEPTEYLDLKQDENLYFLLNIDENRTPIAKIRFTLNDFGHVSGEITRDGYQIKLTLLH